MIRNLPEAAARVFAAVVLLHASPAIHAQVPTTLNDFLLPGSQPGDSGNLEQPSKCDNCHGGYDLEVEPAFNWRGSMMAQAARDPLFYACMTIANQDAPESGDLCIRCHTPSGWLEGRSVPTDGSALSAGDREGIQCDFCHKLVDPQAEESPSPYDHDAFYVQLTRPADREYLATLADLVPPAHANGMYAADSNNAKRGPFVDAEARHQMYYSPFHSESQICGTCHDVSNPVYERIPNPDYPENDPQKWLYQPNAFGAPSPSFDPKTMFPVERTFSEWAVSDFNIEGVTHPLFAGFYNKETIHTCQDCHMQDVSGYGCNKKGTPWRNDLPLHDMTGGNTFIPTLVAELYPDEVDPVALLIGQDRARATLQKAALLDMQVDNGKLQVKVTNLTGHKLPSGYPEGRRIWVNVTFLDEAGQVVKESGRYDFDTAELAQDPEIKVYEIKPGIGENIASAVNLPADVSFHFVLNNRIYKDNRIPPIGVTNDELTMIQSPVIGAEYADGQNWDVTAYAIPPGAVSAEATLYYQTLSKDYVTFLRDANETNHWGQTLYDLWAANGKSAPEVMAQAAMDIPALNIEVNGQMGSYTWSSYANQDTTPVSCTVEDEGATIRLEGNIWKRVLLDYDVNEATVIEFDFQSSREGEIHYVGFDDNNVHSRGDHFFQLYGTQLTWAYQDFHDYDAALGVQHFVIPVGHYFTGSMKELVLAADDDVGANGESVFSNIRIYDVQLNVTVKGATSPYSFASYANQDATPLSFTVEEDGAALRLEGNSWKRVLLDYYVSEHTVVEFDFQSGRQGEIHYVGFDDNNLHGTSDHFFQLYGTQITWAHQDFHNYDPAGGVQHYIIPVGHYFTGNITELVLATDDDAYANGESVFSNIRLYEGVVP